MEQFQLWTSQYSKVDRALLREMFDISESPTIEDFPGERSKRKTKRELEEPSIASTPLRRVPAMRKKRLFQPIDENLSRPSVIVKRKFDDFLEVLENQKQRPSVIVYGPLFDLEKLQRKKFEYAVENLNRLF